ncbi:grpE protein homolog 1, mitochondrial [Alca torda]
MAPEGASHEPRPLASPAATPTLTSPSTTRWGEENAPRRSFPQRPGRAAGSTPPASPEACVRFSDWSSSASLLGCSLADWRRSGGGPEGRAEAVRGQEGAMAAVAQCVRGALRPRYPLLSFSLRTSPRLLCVATQQKNTGQNLEEDQSQSQNEQKVEPSSAEKMLTEEKAKLEEQLKEVTDKYKRALADAENVRQRSQKLVEEAKLYGIQSFCKDLLEVADILEKATESVPKEEIKDENPHLKSLYEGLVMTEVQIQKVFKKHGLLRLNPVGAKFDPYEHEALFHAPMEGKEPGTIALVSKIGYKLHGRTLRPALVGVVKDA